MAERLPRPDRVEGRALSPRAFRPFGIEAVMLGPPTTQEGLVRREGVATWRRMAEHGRCSTGWPPPPPSTRTGCCRCGWWWRHPGPGPGHARPRLGERAARVQAAIEPPPVAGWLLLVDEGPGETWLYLADEDHPAAVLDGFLGRRGRTDFARARRRSGIGSLASLGLLLGLFLVIYGSALGLGRPASWPGPG